MHELAASPMALPLSERLSRLLPYCGLLLAFTIFSGYTVLMKKAISDGTSPLVLALLRELIATSVLLPAAWAVEQRRPASERRFWPAREDRGDFVLLGSLMIWGTQLLSALALDHLSANSYALLAPSVPVFCLVIAVAAGSESFDLSTRPSQLKIAAVFVTVVGAAWIAVGAFLGSPVKDRGSVGLGLAFLLTNKLCVASYPVLESRLFARYSPTTVVAWGYATGSLLTFISVVPAISDMTDGKGMSFSIGPSGWVAILYSALLSSAFNYTLMAAVNKHTSPLTVMSFYPWQSIATPTLSWLILGSPLKRDDAIGGTIIVCGLYLLTAARSQEVAAGAADAHSKLVEEPEPGPDPVISVGGESNVDAPKQGQGKDGKGPSIDEW
jgi:drug/metabolite transporter (DMT)-like permease